MRVLRLLALSLTAPLLAGLSGCIVLPPFGGGPGGGPGGGGGGGGPGGPGMRAAAYESGPPVAGYIWIEGFWDLTLGARNWVPGHWGPPHGGGGR